MDWEVVNNANMKESLYFALEAEEGFSLFVFGVDEGIRIGVIKRVDPTVGQLILRLTHKLRLCEVGLELIGSEFVDELEGDLLIV